MEGKTTITGQQGNEKPLIDVKKWLSENKLMKSWEMFEKSDIQIEELCEFDNNELKELCKDNYWFRYISCKTFYSSCK